MKKIALFVSVLTIALSLTSTQVFAKGSKDKGSKKKSSRTSSMSSPSNSTSKPNPFPSKKRDNAEEPANNTTAAPASGGGAGAAIAAGVGGAVVGGLAGAAIASSMSGDDKPATSSTTIEKTAPSPLLKMTPEEAVKSATEMQIKASDAGFGFSKSDEMLKKATELMAKDDAGKKKAQEIAVIVHTWAETGVKQADELKKIAEKLGL
ncbi:MAG: hypothetical protein KAG34_04135 [Cocleimonas sp.]|nr:hypothetical protein [Cocleimonas sp.]